MDIFVLDINNKTITFKFRSEDLVKDVKKQISLKIGMPVSQMRVLCYGRNLEDEYSLSHYNIQSCYSLHVRPILRGGGFPSIKFNSMNEPTIGKFSTEAPEWRNIAPGLNLEGVCKNKSCQAFKKQVWINKYFGKFNMTMQVYKSPCPICKQLCQSVENMGLYQARCVSTGKIKGESDERKMESWQMKKGEFLTFQDKDETRVEWLYLQMQVFSLKTS